MPADVERNVEVDATAVVGKERSRRSHPSLGGLRGDADVGGAGVELRVLRHEAEVWQKPPGASPAGASAAREISPSDRIGATRPRSECGAHRAMETAGW